MATRPTRPSLHRTQTLKPTTALPSPLPLLISAGEPAGIGPELCLQLASQRPDLAQHCRIIADPELLQQRAQTLKAQGQSVADPAQLQLLPTPLQAPCQPGQLDPANARYVLNSLDLAVDHCLTGQARGLITGPVHKGNINQAGIAFSGHTEYLAQRCQQRLGQSVTPLMLLATPGLRVALATTHLALRQVADNITPERLTRRLNILHQGLQSLLKRPPRIAVLGLNPHAGEDGHLGHEEQQIIQPTIQQLQQQGLKLDGPLPADTAFTPDKLPQYDAYFAMYHDQGLAVLKHKGFGQAVNITLGLPMLRTSVDHGTALTLAGSGKAKLNSLIYAIETALDMAQHRP